MRIEIKHSQDIRHVKKLHEVEVAVLRICAAIDAALLHCPIVGGRYQGEQSSWAGLDVRLQCFHARLCARDSILPTSRVLGRQSASVHFDDHFLHVFRGEVCTTMRPIEVEVEIIREKGHFLRERGYSPSTVQPAV